MIIGYAVSHQGSFSREEILYFIGACNSLSSVFAFDYVHFFAVPKTVYMKVQEDSNFLPDKKLSRLETTDKFCYTGVCS